MKKDKEWAQKEVDRYLSYEEVVESRNALIFAKGVINQLDETTKPVIPQFVADWLEEAKYNELTLFGAMIETHRDREVDYWFVESDDNQDLFARAWLDGYTVEKEEKYILSINITDKVSKTNYKTYLNKRGIFHSMENKSFNSEEFNWTEEEIKCLENGEILFEHFATKVEELEE